jgi:hypothetical protein
VLSVVLFDGYKGQIAIDPHSELVTDTVMSAGNVGAFAGSLIAGVKSAINRGRDHRRLAPPDSA